MNIDFDLKCTTGGFALEYPVNECLRNLVGSGGQPPAPIPPCAIYPLGITGAANCVDMVPAAFCGAIHQYTNNAWGIYRSPGITEVTVGVTSLGANIPSGANYLHVTDVMFGNTNCHFIRITDDTTEPGALALPANVVIYLDPNVRWTVPAGIAGTGSLTLMGSGGNNELNIAGLITGFNRVSIHDIRDDLVNAGMRGISGVPEVYVRDCVLKCQVNNFYTGAGGNLTIHDSTIDLTGVALTASAGNVELTRITVTGTPPLRLLSGYTNAEVDEFTYSGSTNTGLVLRRTTGGVTRTARFSEIRDISGVNGTGGLLDLRIEVDGTSNTGISYREVNGFYGGNQILTDISLNATPLPNYWQNITLRGLEFQSIILPDGVNLYRTILENVILDDIRFVDSAAIDIYATYRFVQISNWTMPDTVAMFLVDSFLASGLVGVSCDTVEMTNIISGPIQDFRTIGAAPIHKNWYMNNVSAKWDLVVVNTLKCDTTESVFWNNIKCEGWFNFVTSGFPSHAPTGLTLSNVHVNPAGTAPGPTAPANMTLGNATIRLGPQLSNIVVEQTGTVFITSSDMAISNLLCGAIVFSPGVELVRMTNIYVFGSLTINCSNSTITNLYTNASIFVSGTNNLLTDVFYSLQSNATFNITGNQNGIKGIRTSGNQADILITGDSNSVSDVILIGGASGTDQQFSVTGDNNKFTNIQLGVGTAPTDLLTFGSVGDGSTVTLGGINNYFCNMWVLQKRENLLSLPPSQSRIFIGDPAGGSILNHYVNCVFYRDTLVNFPTNPNVHVCGSDHTLMNCRVGQNLIGAGGIGTFDPIAVLLPVGINTMAIGCRVVTPVTGTFGGVGMNWLNVPTAAPAAGINSLDQTGY